MRALIELLITTPDGRKDKLVFESMWPIVRPVFAPDDASILASVVVEDNYEIVEISLRGDARRDRVWTTGHGVSSHAVLTPSGLAYLTMTGEGWGRTVLEDDTAKASFSSGSNLGARP